MKFSEKIIKIRKENGLSQEEFGNKINVSRQAISKWKSEQSQPEVEKIKEISKVFGVSIEYLLNDEFKNDNTKKVSKFNKKKFGKCLLKVIIVLIIIYLMYSAYKFIILYKRYKNIQNISDNEICEGTYTTYYEDKITKNMAKSSNSFLGGKEAYIAKRYLEFSSNYVQEYNVIDRDIVYINKEKDLLFYLVYDAEKQKYIYNKNNSIEMEKNEIMETHISRKDLYMQAFLESNILSDTPIFIQILKASIDPTILVTKGYMKYFYGDGFKVVEFNDMGAAYEGISKAYTFTDEEESTTMFDLNVVYNYNSSYYNEEGAIIEYNLLNDIDSVEDLAKVCGIEVIDEE